MKTLSSIGLFAAVAMLASPAFAATYIPGNLVVSVEGNGVEGALSGGYTDNQAAPLTLFQFSHNGTASASYVSALVLPQTASGANSPISGEYGSSSEGALQLSGNGKLLTIMGYGVNAAAFNADPTAYGTTQNGGTIQLGQSGSLKNAGYTTVPRVVAAIGANGSVNTTTALTGVFDGNNPRSVYTYNGTSFYVSGQGDSPDSTGGVFYAQRGATTATAITGNDTSGKTSSQDTRFVTVYNGQLYVSVDSKEGSGSNRSFIGTLGAANALPTSLANNGNGPTQLNGFGTSMPGKYKITATNGNGVNSNGTTINLSPEEYFFASPDILYVADSGFPKNNSAVSSGNSIGDGGLQKWTFSNGTWTLDYTLAAGLGLVANTAASGTTGLIGLTGEVVGGDVELFATNYTIKDTDPTYLYGITDVELATTKPSGETFTQLAAAPVDSNFKGVSFAPVPEPGVWAMLLVGFGAVGSVLRGARRRAAA